MHIAPRRLVGGIVLQTLLFSVLVVGISLSSLLYYKNYSNNYHSFVEASLRSVNQLRVKHIQQWRNERLGDASVLFQNQLFARLVKSSLSGKKSEGNSGELHIWIEQVRRAYHYDRVQLLDPSGHVLFSTPKTEKPVSTDMPSRVQHAIEQRQVIFEDFHHNDLDGKDYLSLLIPIFDPSDTARATGIVTLRLDPMWGLLPLLHEQSTLHETEQTVLISRKGGEIFSLNPSPGQESSMLALGQGSERDDQTVLARITSGQEGTFSGVDHLGTKVLADIRTVPGTHWSLVTYASYVELFDPLKRRLIAVVLFGALLFLAGGSGLFLLISRQRHRHQTEVDELHNVFRSLFENMLNGFVYGKVIYEGEQAVDLQYLIVNEAFEQQTGLSGVENRLFSQIMPNARELDQEFLGIHGEVARTGKPQHFEYHLKSVDLWLSVSMYSPERGYFVSIFDVINERKEAEEALKHQQRLLQETGEMAHVGGWEFNPETGEGTWTDEVARIHGLNPTDETNRDIGLSFFHGEHRERIEAAMQEAATHGTPYDLELELVTRKGEKKWVRTICRPMMENGRVVQMRGSFQDITHAKLMESTLRSSEKKFKDFFQNAPEPCFILSEASLVRDVNRKVTEHFGYTREELTGQPLDVLASGMSENELQGVLETWNKDNRLESVEVHISTKEGEERTVLVSAALIVSSEAGEDLTILILRDVTEIRSLQSQLERAQKMESIGRLAGGIAHDFNNMLSVILGRAELILSTLDKKDPIRSDISEILKAGSRSQELTHQLLTFARKQATHPVVLNLNDAIETSQKLLERLIAEEIELRFLPDENLWNVEIDPVQVDQILANLIVNARDAIEGTGEITIETQNISINEEYANAHIELHEGDYAQISISDTGIGMTREVIENIFEPFFTTKSEGKGTGLGLATVYGIVKQNGGFINVYSEPNIGTTFKIFLTKSTGELDQATVVEDRRVYKGDETILVVEDDPQMLNLCQMILESVGYDVLFCDSPTEALTLAEQNKDKIRVLLTDVVLPEMNGKELKQELSQLIPDLRVLYISGYTADVISKRGVLSDGGDFLQKPFSPRELASRIRKLIDTPS